VNNQLQSSGMKKVFNIIRTIAVLTIVLTTACKSNDHALADNGSTEMKLFCTGDSGFVSYKNGLDFLISKGITDTSKIQEYHNNSDTIGKYYKIPESGNYIVCMKESLKKLFFPTLLLLEIQPDGNIIKKERYIHGNWDCCWKNDYEGFNKYGQFFSLKTCTTGSGLCAGSLYVFKEVSPQDELTPITESHYSYNYTSNVCTIISSKFEAHGDFLRMYYQLDFGGRDENDSIIIHESNKFFADYYYINNKWVIPDSAALQSKGLYNWITH